MPKLVDAIFIQEITVVDPDSKGEVSVGIWKDPVSGGIFGLDSSFLDQVDKYIVSPFDRTIHLRLPEQK